MQIRKSQEIHSERWFIFAHFHFSDQTFFKAEKVSIRDIANTWHLKIAQTILLWYKTLNLEI